MKFYLDSADAAQWRLPAGCPPVQGVTTNPTLLRRSGQPCTLEHLRPLSERALALGVGMGEVLKVAQQDPEEARTAAQTHFIRTDDEGVRHVVVTRRIPGYPLRLMVSTTSDWALANWNETRNITLILALLLSLGAAGATVFFVRVVRQIENNSEALRAQHQFHAQLGAGQAQVLHLGARPGQVHARVHGDGAGRADAAADGAPAPSRAAPKAKAPPQVFHG